MSNQVSPIPEGFRSITPYLIVPDGEGAEAFYMRAFGAIEITRMNGEDGRLRHAELQIGDSRLMMGEHFNVDPRGADAIPRANIYLYVEDAEAVFNSAVAAGGRVLSHVTKKPYGNLEGGLEDPYGIVWWVATRVEIV